MILNQLADSTRERVEQAKANTSFAKIRKMAEQEEGRENFAFENALRGNELSFICEVKKASPSKGLIAEKFPYLNIAKEYEEAGAAAISVLTEPEYFMGSNKYLTEISKIVHIPILRKDFILDTYQIYEAKAIGADAVLLICALLDTQMLKQYIEICDELGISALVEAHTEEEVDSAIQSGARMIGVNNRNLKTFEVNIQNAVCLRKQVPEDILFVAESGIQTDKDINILKNAGVNAVLIGETLMKSSDKKAKLSFLRGE